MIFVLVSGGFCGFGCVICLKLAEAGYFVLINYTSKQAEAEITLLQVCEKGGDGEIMRFDVADQTDVEATLGKWLESNPDKPIEVLVNNAGIRKDQLLMWMSNEEWNSVLGIGFGGFFNVTRLIIKGMLVKN